MPRKPTAIAREARKRIIQSVAGLAEGAPLPTTRELGETHDLHPSTIFRILRDLAAEGVVWQCPNGRFYPAGAQSNALRGAALCFIGREMWQWSRLYQEILEGVSEVCSANGSPLIFLSSASLVRQRGATEVPEYSRPLQQQRDLERLRETLPRGCAGYLFDHLWYPERIERVFAGGGAQAVQLLRTDVTGLDTIAPDVAAGAQLVAEHISSENRQVYLVRPFQGDPAIDAMMASLHTAFGGPISEISFSEAERSLRSGKETVEADRFYLCPEDNAALALQEIIALQHSVESRTIRVIGTQGTSLLAAPTWRLRYDYRRLGRSAAARILHGTEPVPIQPSWISN